MHQDLEKNKKTSSLHKFLAYQSRMKSYEFYAAGDIQNFILLSSKASQHTNIADKLDSKIGFKFPKWRAVVIEDELQTRDDFQRLSQTPLLMI